jgi:hypothetical protein
MKPHHLEGEGEFLYDYKQDILTFKMQKRDYKKSVELQNFVIDIDTKGFVTGLRVFDASVVFGVDRYVLNNIVQGKFKARIEDNVLTLTISIVGRKRNKIMNLLGEKERFSQQLTNPLGSSRLADSVVECTV